MQQHSFRPDLYVIYGYGPSMWVGNVGMMQSTQPQLERVAQLQADQDNGNNDDPNLVFSECASNIPVDLDFQQALRNSAVTL